MSFFISQWCVKVFVGCVQTFVTFLCFNIIFFSSALHAQGLKRPIPTLPLTRHFDSRTYQGGIQNWDIRQSNNGLLYVANNFGLLEFDGSQWKRYDVIQSTKLRALHTSLDGRIYVGGSKTFGYFHPDSSGLSFHKVDIPASFGTDEIWNLFPTDQGLLISGLNSLLIWSSDTLRKVNLSGVVPGLAQQVDGRIFVNGTSGGIYEWIKGSLQKIQGSEIFKGDLNGVLSDDRGTIFFLSDEGRCFRWNGTFLPFTTPLDGFLSQALINVSLKLSNNQFVIGTQNDGLVITNQQFEPVKYLTRGRGLNNRSVLSLHEDPFNNLWVGLNNGLTLVELGYPLTLINEEMGLEGTGYAALPLGRKLYLGTSNGLFINEEDLELTDGEYRQLFRLLPKSQGVVNNLSKINNEVILSHHSGAYTVQDDRLQPFFDHTGTWKFMRLHKTDELIGGTYQGFYRFGKKNGFWELEEPLEEPSESARIFEFENDSTLWMTHGYKGVYRIVADPGWRQVQSVHHYGGEDGFPSDLLINVYKIDGALLFTSEKGLFTYDEAKGKFVPHTFLNNLLGPAHISKLATDARGNIYFIQDGQIGFLKKTSIGRYKLKRNTFRRVNHLLSDNLENIAIIDDQNVLFGAKEGFIHYNPLTDLSPKQHMTVLIRSMETESNQKHRVLHANFFQNVSFTELNSIRFNFSSPYFDGLDDIAFAYRLVPFEAGWSEWTGVNFKEYTNLAPGAYTFEVKARNMYGQESDIQTATFTVVPKWYESQLAYALYTVAGFMIFGLIVFGQQQKHKKEKAELTLETAQQIKSKEIQIDEVAKKSSETIEKLKNERLEMEVAHKNSELAAVTMQLLTNKEFMVAVRKKIEEALHKGTEDRDLEKVLKSIDNNLKQEDWWEQFSYHFDQVHEHFLHRLQEEVKLTPQEIKLSAFLRLNMTTKDIAQLMNISVRGVELARYRFRKKLNIDRETNLVDYLSRF